MSGKFHKEAVQEPYAKKRMAVENLGANVRSGNKRNTVY